ncbi:KpsF/GutQ family sugar-phosphate isomerase [Bombella sp. ESL0378]|uniref:KpsF/GutQ family sugar-phosphate isomerase n=1 Tax=unclassified Bombella TaxID=2644098 RepID=UPI0012D94104|nr:MULTISPECIES: KpsF/GutQ family sugar-phosphate isomerase [unclassified Bombella]MCT6855581.1 KpsF/GutQ family sugar-phosphate isomerase [Bombella apis]MUG04457.1 KpsF/GutQ family sugar-phosphate isomerase [Bombella sp. ESL0378]MUG89952.1 KpsF/GutQ family sugar-phosphate isomerase [Bombella sp. ESL0385]
MTSPSLATACHALLMERQGLEQLEAALQGPMQVGFEAALEAILTMKGRLVLTGMGKSGHIGRKINATLASTGTPSLFLHAAEAAHGDLGMVERGDVILYLSNSGETDELAPILLHATRLGLVQIALTSNPDSTLARAVQIPLILPQVPEACPMGLAPTTSCLLQLALGDALAIALLGRRGFNQDDFHQLHPAGTLGARLRPVSDFMHSGDEMPLGQETMPLRSIILEMTRKRFGCIGILDEAGRLSGFISDGDLRPALERDLDATYAADIMNRSPLTTTAHARAQEVQHLMSHRPTPVSSLFVLDEERRPLGILHIHDLLRAGLS